MAAIILPEKWRRQPTYSVKLDLTNPLSRGIVFAGDGFQRDVVTGRKLTPGPGATNLLVPDNMRRYGAGYKYQFAPGNGQGAFTHTLDTPIQNSVATLALLYSGGANDGNSLLSLNRADSTTGAVRFICSGDRIQAGSINASTSNQTPGDNTTAGDWPAAVATFNGIAYREVTTLKGTYTGSVSIDPGADLSRVVLGNIYISGALTWGASGGAIACPVVWNRVISDAETREYIRAPWALFKKSARILYFPSAGGGGATLTADSGTYTLTGTAATLKADRKLAAGSGSYAVTGTDAALKVGRKLSADSGTYSVTGTAVNFLRGYALAAESGSYSVSGTDAALRVGRLLSAASGSYVLSGSAAALQYQPAGSYSLTAESGAYTLTGTAATLKVSRKLTAESGSYSLTGSDATFKRGFSVSAGAGSYTLTGTNVAFARTYVLGAETGAYTLTGSDVGLTWSAAPVVETPTHGGPSIYGKAVFREAEFKREYEREVSRIEAERFRARQMREDEELVIIMAALAA